MSLAASGATSSGGSEDALAAGKRAAEIRRSPVAS